MLLDLYYKMLWWYACAAAKRVGAIDDLAVKLANGKIYSQIDCNGSGSASLFAMRSFLAAPMARLLSQTAALPLGDVYGFFNTNLIVGAGTTPVTPSDYKIETEIVSDLVCEGVTAELDESAGAITYRKTLRNSGESEITINEIGLAAPYATDRSTLYHALIYREVLETPLVLEPGESGTVAITIKHTLPA